MFDIIKNNETLAAFKTRLFGEHNLLNALAVIAIADRLKIPLQTIARALETFNGIKRRQEIRGEKRQITVIDDFAHHPTAVRETVRAVKSVHGDGRLIALRDAVEDLVGFFHHIGSQRGEGLLAVPGAAAWSAQPATEVPQGDQTTAATAAPGRWRIGFGWFHSTPP